MVASRAILQSRKKDWMELYTRHSNHHSESKFSTPPRRIDGDCFPTRENCRCGCAPEAFCFPYRIPSLFRTSLLRKRGTGIVIPTVPLSNPSFSSKTVAQKNINSTPQHSNHPSMHYVASIHGSIFGRAVPWHLCRLELFDGGNHLFRHDLFGKLVSSRIKIGILREGLVLDLTVVNVQGISLAASDQPLANGAGVGHHHAKMLGEVSVGVGVKCDVGVSDLLVLGPSLHDCWVVDTVDHDFLDTDGR
mmetsp:Transcript_12491/g.25801  ORF Transcript_12491/g.25801 Transcript_12491/m.25801 type:complete len:248 (+) Transcript_12491:145-888(+)